MNDKYKVQEFTDEFVKSTEFLKTYEWRRLRKYVLTKYQGKCMCCGKTAGEDIYLNVDHILPRKTHPELALVESNLQILCNECNHGKGNWNTTDWRTSASFVVTDKWLEQFRTEAGGYTKIQLKALTGSYKPKAGWKKKIIGSQITQEQRKDFEDGREKLSKRTLAIKEHSQNQREKNRVKNEIELLKLQVEAKTLKDKLNN